MSTNYNAEENWVLDSFDGAHLVVTGVTGFLGKVWLAMLLHYAPGIRRVTCLVRDRKDESAQERVRNAAETSPAFRAAREALGHTLLRRYDERVRVLSADLAVPGCGLDEKTIEGLSQDADVVLHFAGLTDFEPDPNTAVATNILGTAHVADLTARLKVPRLVHVSTCFVAGEASGDVAEEITTGISPNGTKCDPAAEIEGLRNDLAKLETRSERVAAANTRALRLGWPNIYTLTKGLGEHLIELRDDVRAITVRPAIVECAREYPFPGWNEGLNTSGPLVYLFSTSFRHFPARSDHRFDVIPVDTVARSMMLVAAAALRDEADDVYQLGSSAINPLTFRRAIELTNLGVRRMHAKSGESWKERVMLKNMDVIPIGADEEPPFSVGHIRRTAQATRDLIRKVNLKRDLPPTLYDKIGDKLNAKLKSWSMSCRNADRKMGRVQDMLRLYRPFIHDHDYAFCADRIQGLSDKLGDTERELFAYDVDSLDWRHYWLKVQVPGLEKWCLPTLDGGEIPQDDALPPAATQGTQAHKQAADTAAAE